MRVIIRSDEEGVASWVAAYIRKRINDAQPTAEKPFVLGLPTGGSPILTYKKLVEMVKKKTLSFEHVITFNMDEYVGLPKEHPESYHSFMWNHLFKHIDIKPSNVHILDGNAKDLEKECSGYEASIEAAGGIDLFLGGVGTDGHIAFNEPGSSLQSVTRVKTLAYETVVANKRFFGNEEKNVPKMALTVGVKTIMDAREVLLIVTGSNKASALEKCIEHGVNHMYTMSMLQMHPRGCVVCDDAATAELRVRTVNYFKGLDYVHSEMLGKEFIGATTLTRQRSTSTGSSSSTSSASSGSSASISSTASVKVVSSTAQSSSSSSSSTTTSSSSSTTSVESLQAELKRMQSLLEEAQRQLNTLKVSSEKKI
eukprot:TRINITY_DN918_c0_g1_i1.p1 TRINITY_DN918_c0_g1~~TRINITY_DN918_c0_g1_i1.p1  ORF type:complete len:368 (+),score=99.24 TRINITY_DN918_c0_g1_i1:78-1181(+)